MSRRRVSGTGAPALRSACGTTAAGRSSSTAPTPPGRSRSSPPGGRRTATSPTCTKRSRGFNANVNVTLRTAPRIANEASNADISIAYYNAAGIPDLNGNPWTTISPNILSGAQIAAGGLFTQGSTCPQRKFDVFVTPAQRAATRTRSPTRRIWARGRTAQLDTFVQQGGGWTATCHSIVSNENDIADLTQNGSLAVKSLFKTSLPGGLPGGFLTTNGFPVIDNTGGTATINPTEADLPTAQIAPTTTAQTLPGGSVQTWPSPGNQGAPTYWPTTERVGFFDTPTGRPRQHHFRHLPQRHRDGEGDLHRRPLVLDVASLRRELRRSVAAGLLQLAVLQRQRRRPTRPDLLAEHVPAQRHWAGDRERHQHGRERRDQRPQRRPHARARLHLRLDDVRAGADRDRAETDLARRPR